MYHGHLRTDVLVYYPLHTFIAYISFAEIIGQCMYAYITMLPIMRGSFNLALVSRLPVTVQKKEVGCP